MTEPLDPFTLPLHGSRLIEASAGTGKTWTIAALYVRLVLGHGDDATRFGRPLTPPQILVMTFTVAATRELSERVRERLVTTADCFRGKTRPAPDDAFLARLIAAYPEGAARDHAAWRLATAAESMDDAAVVTIDAWVQRMLREHAFDSGSVFDEVLEPDQDAMLSEAAHDYWRQEIYPLHGALLDDAMTLWTSMRAFMDELRAVMPRIELVDDDGASLEQACDDAVLRRRWLLAGWKRGWSERLAAMRAWLALQIGRGRRGPFTSQLRAKTVDGWMSKLIEWAEDAERIDFGVTPKALERLSPAGLREYASDPDVELPPDFEAFARIGRPRGLVAATTVMRMHAARRVKARIRMLKEHAGIFGFQDQLERLDRALAGASGDRLRERIVEQFPVALIDEFQDTSPLQYRVFDRLYRTATDDPSTALLLIGDPKQSIYGFRDADIHSYLRARDATRGRHYALTTNYRSTAGLVEAINRLFAEAEPHAEGAFRFGAGPDRPLPFVAVEARGRAERFVAAGGPVAALTIVHDAESTPRAGVLRRFAERCAEHVATLLGDPAAGFVDVDGTFVRLRPADIAVLVRDRNEAAAMQRAMRRRRIASVFLSDQDSVFASDEAGDLLHWLRAVADPLDARRARIAFATRFADLSIDEMAALATEDDRFEARVEELKRLNVEWREQGVLSMLRRSLHLLDLPARWLAADDGERRLTNVLHLAELLQAESARLDGDQALIRWLGERLADGRKRSDDEIVRLESDSDLVRVVTVHKAKGLEYSVVYLPFAANVRDPSSNVAWLPDDDGVRQLSFDLDAPIKARMQLEARQEELRLLYVALTRARHALWLGVTAPLYYNNCAFHRSAFGYLLTADRSVTAEGIEAVLRDRFEGLASVRLVAADAVTPVTRLVRDAVRPPLHDAPIYDATFERDWSIGSFSALIRDLAHVPRAAAIVDAAVEDEMLLGPRDDEAVAVAATAPSNAARHRFPRGPFAGSFLHDQLEWLAEERFALGDPDVRQQLAARCRHRGWGQRADDVVEWMREVASTVLPPIGVALDGLRTILPEMEFWFPNEALAAGEVDRLCALHLLPGRERPALAPRALRGMLMGFADLVFEAGGRYWVLDYKSNALGIDDADYSSDAMEQSMAAHRYDVQGAIYLLALHRLLRQRLGDDYDPARQLGGALFVFIRGIVGPRSGCCVLAPDADLLAGLEAMLDREPASIR